jgi:hypothetical protein
MVARNRNTIWPPPPQLPLHRRGSAVNQFKNGALSAHKGKRRAGLRTTAIAPLLAKAPARGAVSLVVGATWRYTFYTLVCPLTWEEYLDRPPPLHPFPLCADCVPFELVVSALPLLGRKNCGGRGSNRAAISQVTCEEDSPLQHTVNGLGVGPRPSPGPIVGNSSWDLGSEYLKIREFIYEHRGVMWEMGSKGCGIHC